MKGAAASRQPQTQRAAWWPELSPEPAARPPWHRSPWHPGRGSAEDTDDAQGNKNGPTVMEAPARPVGTAGRQVFKGVQRQACAEHGLSGVRNAAGRACGCLRTSRLPPQNLPEEAYRLPGPALFTG